MSYELRRVRADWVHPVDEQGQPKALGNQSLYDRLLFQFAEGYRTDPPDRADFMPNYPSDTRTHYQLFETDSGGTPVSPVMPAMEALAQWLTDHPEPQPLPTYQDWLRLLLHTKQT